MELLHLISFNQFLVLKNMMRVSKSARRLCVTLCVNVIRGILRLKVGCYAKSITQEG
jgi:hypothetical protein